MEQTVKCPICGEPYVTYAHYAGDQSACPNCRMRARQHRGEWKKYGTFKDHQIGYPINRKRTIHHTHPIIDNYFSSSVTKLLPIDPKSKTNVAD